MQIQIKMNMHRLLAKGIAIVQSGGAISVGSPLQAFDDGTAIVQDSGPLRRILNGCSFSGISINSYSTSLILTVIPVFMGLVIPVKTGIYF
jgi:hypothetical protein